MNLDLFLYSRLAQGTGYEANITKIAQGWWHTTRAVGGYWQAGFDVTPDQVGRSEMGTFWATALGKRVVEKLGGIVTWEGEIVRLDLVQKGVKFTRSLNPALWMNKVAVKYGDTMTAWSENTDSQDIYGESAYLDEGMLEFDATSAAAEQAKILLKHAWPLGRVTGGLGTQIQSDQPDSLTVQCAGHVFGMNRRYYDVDHAATNRSTIISTVVGTSEFVTAGIIDTNTDDIAVECAAIPTRTWDLLQTVIDSGDDSGADWVGGVYAGRKFNYNLAETAVTHYWRNGQLLDKAGAPVIAQTLKAGIVVQVSDMPKIPTPAGGATIANTRNVYIEEVEFIAPDGFRLSYAEDL